MTDRYLSVAREGGHEIEIKRSRFLCALAPVTSADTARAVIAARRKAEPAARHHCHAFVLGPDGIRAYGAAVAEAIDAVGVAEYRRLRLVEVSMAYDRAGRFENDLRASPYVLRGTRFDERAHFEVGLAPGESGAFEAWLADLTGGETAPVDLGESWVRVKDS